MPGKYGPIIIPKNKIPYHWIYDEWQRKMRNYKKKKKRRREEE